MPLYNYECRCGNHFTSWNTMSDCRSPKVCPGCGRLAPRGISRPRVMPDYEGYTCPVTGKWIEGRSAHEENLKRTGCRVLEPGELKDAENRRKANDAAFDKSLDDTIEKELSSLPDSALKSLETEITSGVSATVERL